MMLKDDSEKPSHRDSQPESDPPPYFQASSSSSFKHPPRHPSSSRSFSGALNSTKECDHTRRPSSTLCKPPATPIAISNVYGNSSTNHVAIKTSREPINGAFSIDPSLPIPDHASMFKVSKKTRRRKGNSFQAEDDLKTNALFETRQGSIKLDLSIVGGQGVSTKCRVDARTKQGNVDLNVLEIQPMRQISLDVETRQGDIHLFLPRNFSGPVHLYSKRGNLIFLPVFSSHMKIIKAKADEALVMVSPSKSNNNLPSSSSTPVTGYQGDYARLTSRSGTIIVGLVGEDTKSGETGWWKKMTKFLFGE